MQRWNRCAPEAGAGSDWRPRDNGVLSMLETHGCCAQKPAVTISAISALVTGLLAELELGGRLLHRGGHCMFANAASAATAAGSSISTNVLEDAIRAAWFLVLFIVVQSRANHNPNAGHEHISSLGLLPLALGKTL